MRPFEAAFWLRRSLLLLGALWCLGCDRGPEPTLRPLNSTLLRRPNVVWVLLDACRPDHLSAYGYTRPTSPQIDRLAARGTLFLSNYAQASNTLLSVPSYMTGRFEAALYQDAHHLGLWLLRTPPKQEVLISTILSENGYQTAMFSASPWYSANSRLGRSFDTFGELARGAGVQDVSFQERNPDLFRWLGSHAEGPFFLYLHSLDTHSPRFDHNTEQTWLDESFPWQRDKQLRRWRGAPYSASDQAHIRDLYDGAVAHADSTVAELVTELKALGILSQTLIIISSDHGEVLGQDGSTLGHPAKETVDDLLHTPLILAGPGIPRGRRVDVRTQNADIVPTLADLLVLATEAEFDGKSLRPLLEAEPAEPLHDIIFARGMRWLPGTEYDQIVLIDDLKFVFKERGELEVWALPDRVGGRRAVVPSETRRARVEAIRRDRLAPLWKIAAQQPREAPPVFYLRPRGFRDINIATSLLDASDGKWTYRKARSTHGKGEILFSFPWQEETPELGGEHQIPDGTYEVSIYSQTLEESAGGRGSSLAFRSGEEAEFRTFVLEPAESGEMRETWFNLGTYTVSGSPFAYAIRAGRETHVAVVGRLRFRKLGSDVQEPTRKERQAEEQKLRTLGYID